MAWAVSPRTHIYPGLYEMNRSLPGKLSSISYRAEQSSFNAQQILVTAMSTQYLKTAKNWW